MRTTALLFRGQKLRRTGKSAEALTSLTRAAERAPDSAHVALHRALAAADAGQLDEALSALAQAAERWPENPVFPLFRGGLLVENDRLDEADSALAAARELSPRNLLVEAYAALAAMRRGDVDGAMRRLAAIGLTDNPRALAALLAEVEAELFRRFGTDSDASPPSVDDLPPPAERLRRQKPADLTKAGIAALDKGDAATGWQLLSLAVEKDPACAEAIVHLGCACFDLGLFDQAVELFERVGDDAEMIELVHLHRGASEYKLGRFDEAVASLAAAREADKLGEFATWIHFYLGRAHVALGHADEARAELRRFVDLEGDMALARVRQARELLGLAVPETAPKGFQVIEDGRKTIVVRPGYAEAVRERTPAEGGALPTAGRGPVERIVLPDGVGLVRHYRHGGVAGHVLQDVYFGGTRFLRELGVADALARRGVATPEVIAGVCDRLFPGVYCADMITRAVPGARDLARALRALPSAEEPQAAKRQLLLAAARLVAHCHREGLDHPDLNAGNILIAPDGTATIIDLDRADLLPALSPRRRIAAVARLYRSLHKLGLAPGTVTDADWSEFLEAYAAEAPALDATTDELLARCHRALRRHRLWWRLTAHRPRA